MDFKSEIDYIFKENGFILTEIQKEQFEKYYQLLIEWNEKMNLTAITEQNDVIIKHFLDSCLGEKLIPANSTVMDIGCGAGFPSIPLKIIRPDLKFVLVDSLQKRLTFLNEVITKLLLQNVSLVHSRAEDLSKNTNYREKMDIVVARAVAKLPTLLEYCLPYVKQKGCFLAYKSNVDEEINQSNYALSQLGGKIKDVKHISIYEQQRTLVLVEKFKQTPLKYPRGQNKPRLQPLEK